MHEKVSSVRRGGVLRVRSRSCEGAQHGSGSETGPEEVGGEHVYTDVYRLAREHHRIYSLPSLPIYLYTATFDRLWAR